MLSIKPITGYVATDQSAETVIAPAYDNFTPKQRRAFAEDNPNNYINTVRYIDEFSEKENVSIKQLLKLNKASLESLLNSELYKKADDVLFIYQLETSTGHVQTGIMADLPFTDYENNTIRIHEHTRKDKEKGLSKYIKKVGAISSPVCITYARHSTIDEIVDEVISRPADLSLESDITQRLWLVCEQVKIEALSYYFKQIETCYLADGHHRIASGYRYAQKCKKQNPEHSGDERYNYMLAVLFPDEEMQILAYNRCVRGLNNLSPEAFLQKLATDFIVIKASDKEHAQPMHRHEFGMLLGKDWYKLEIKASAIPSDPVGVLAVSLLQNKILSPILDINNPQKDARLDYVAGDLGIEGMEDSILSGFDIAFSCFPTSIQEMMNVADIGEVMPPKSTWFTPKVRAGLVIARRKFHHRKK